MRLPERGGHLFLNLGKIKVLHKQLHLWKMPPTQHTPHPSRDKENQRAPFRLCSVAWDGSPLRSTWLTGLPRGPKLPCTAAGIAGCAPSSHSQPVIAPLSDEVPGA